MEPTGLLTIDTAEYVPEPRDIEQIRQDLLDAYTRAVESLRLALGFADELAPCSEQSRCRQALAALNASP